MPRIEHGGLFTEHITPCLAPCDPVWSAFNAYDQGYDLAKEFGDAHESDPSNPTDEKDMDLYNNQLGYQIGIDAKSQGYSFDDIPGLVETAVIYQGKGRILKGTR